MRLSIRLSASEPGSSLEFSKLQHDTGFRLRKAKASATATALDTVSLLFNYWGLSPTTTLTKLMLCCDSCSCPLELADSIAWVTLNEASSPDSCRTVISLAVPEFLLATNWCLKCCSGDLASALDRFKPAGFRDCAWASWPLF